MTFYYTAHHATNTCTDPENYNCTTKQIPNINNIFIIINELTACNYV